MIFLSLLFVLYHLVYNSSHIFSLTFLTDMYTHTTAVVVSKDSLPTRRSMIHTHTHTHTQIKILLLPLGGHATWQSQDACALSRHCEPCKQSSCRARNSQENRPFLTASGVGTRIPTWTIVVS